MMIMHLPRRAVLLAYRNTAQTVTTTTTHIRTLASDTYNRQQSIIDFGKQYGAKALVGPFPNRPHRHDSMFADMQITDVDTDTYTVTATLPVVESMTNSYGTMHGGCISTIIDVMGSLALIAADSKRGGVSVDINVSFMNPVKAGDELKCIGKVIKTGKTIGYTQIDMYRQSDNKHVATGRHTKILS